MARRLVLLLAMIVAWYVLLVVWMLAVMLLAGEDIFYWGFLHEVLNPFTLEAESIFYLWIPTGLIALVQFAMLLPAASPIRQSGRPRSLWFAGIMGGVLATLLTIALLVAITDLPRVGVVFGFTTSDGISTAKDVGSNQVEALWQYALIVGGITFILVWAFWTFVLLRALKRTPGGWFGRTIRWLLAGSLLELAIALPLYVIVRRKYNCWCALPSFWSVACGIMAVISLAGPGTLLLWRARRGLPTDAWIDRCMICGYQRAADAGPRCPECGTRWGRLVRARPPGGPAPS